MEHEANDVTNATLTDALHRTLSVFEPGVPRTTPEVTDALDVGRRSTYTRLQRLVDGGHLDTKKVGANARVWWQPPDAPGLDDAPGRTDATGVADGPERRASDDRAVDRYETVLETVDHGIYAVDEDGYLTLVNGAYAELIGAPREDLVGSHVSTVVNEDVVERAKRLEAELAAADRSTAVVESELRRPDGETWVGEATFALMDVGDGHERIGAVRDVTERRARERELEVRMQQQSVVADLGQRALAADSLDDLLRDACRVVTETLGTDYCKILELDAPGESLLLREGVGWDDGVVGTATVSAVESESQAAHTLSTERPVVVEDLDAHEAISGPELLTSHDVESGISTIIGPFEDPWGILGTHATERREYADHDVTFVQSVANTLAGAIDRAGYEAELVRRRKDVAALNALHEVVSDVTDAVVDQSTREEIEAAVCERLVAADSYAFAWVGDADASQTVNVRASAGVDDYLDSVTITVDPDDERSGGPTGRAFRTEDVHASRDIPSDPRHEPWRAATETAGFRSSAAIPVVHEDATYGVLNVYSERRYAFDEQEREVLGRLGEIVGHAIAAAERKRALMSDDVVELGFQIPDIVPAEAWSAPADASVVFESVVPVDDEEFLLYGRGTSGTHDAIAAFADASPNSSELTFRERADGVAFELRVASPPVLSTVAAIGGEVDEAVLDDGDLRLTVHLSPSVDARRVIDEVESAYADAQMLRHVQVTRSREDATTVRRLLETELTDRQWSALDAAYHAGYFEWPRNADAETVAASLDLAPSTFHQHLRKAQRGVLDVVFEAGEPTRRRGRD
ncbi:GAF domain-containing protein [Halorubellus sp. PRR65]|uniref:GAF domain-containing protein n=1 Tax=Halorubellus sp. PRR65 TaxID=3098148 RepID=UPI002B2589F5|nr:GAF domain-containing protein [Halorubellus sp. PRR65]